MRKLALSLAFAFTIGLQAQNTCSTAQAITAGSYVITVIDGTDAPFDCFNNPGTNTPLGEWFTYTPDSDGAIRVSTELEINSGRDTRFHIYTGACDALMCVGGDDDSGDIGNGYLSIDSINVEGGETYIIAFDNRWNALGFTFELTEIPEFFPPFGFTTGPIATEGRVLAAVDMNNDALDDVVTIDSTRIMIHYQQADGSFDLVTYTTTEAAHEPSWSLCVGDLNGDEHNDILYGGGSGVTFMMSDPTGTAFTQVSGPQYVFSQRSNMLDIDNDGNLDAFVCHDVQPNVFYMSDGSGGLMYNQGGLGDTPNGGNYGSIWIDYDNDRDMDLFIAKCRGGQNLAAVDQLHRNNGDGTFTEVAEELDLAGGFHQSWSSAWGDFDMDGDLDVVIGASNFSEGGHKVMRNDGNIFTNVTEGSGLDIFAGTSIEWTTHDFNNDGLLDLLGGGALHLATGPFTFENATSTGNHAIGDLNDDGFLDILGGNSIRYNNGNGNNWLRINTVGTVSNFNGIGARVEITSNLGTQLRDVKSGDGFRYMSSLMTHFGLGDDEMVDLLRIYWPSGIITELENVSVNSTITVVEGVNTGVASVRESESLRLFPNPAENEIFMEIPAAASQRAVIIYDIAGKRVATPALMNNRIDLSGLTSGVYVLELLQDGQVHHQKFTKK